MSKPVIITADSTVDLSPELIERYGIRIIPLTISLDGQTFLDDGSFSSADMYRVYRKNGALPKTAAPSQQDFEALFRPLLEQGYEVVHLDISAELSSTYSIACLAASELPGVHVVDSRMLSTGVGLLAIEGAECRDRGMNATAIAEHLRALTAKVSTSFVLDTLEFMWKGGRCSGVTLLGANLLRIKPALRMKDGKLEVYKKYRGRIESVYRQYYTDELTGRKIRPGHIFMTESGEIPEEILKELEGLVREMTGAKEIHHTVAGCTVSSHCGPKTLGVLFIEE